MAFKKGISGNPAGKPKGSAKIQPLRDQIAHALPEIIRTLIAQAMCGDVMAARLLLERALPALKPQAEPVRFDIAVNDSLANVGQSIIESVSRGELQPDAAALILTTLAGQSKLIESTELITRIEKLEEQAK
ncbi:MAG: hypothetical protein HOP23_05620 [Methylococcaceae bacterium]|nr:hypothetical protein [Methylococcaceae bacterium]NOT11298.1 hypothetical protein [Methylococcaceae bacterium]